MALLHAPEGPPKSEGLTLLDVARFVASEDAVTFASVCQEWGLDPAREVGVEDPWLAMQLRLGLSDALHEYRRKAAEEKDEERRTENQQVDHERRIDRAKKQLGIVTK